MQRRLFATLILASGCARATLGAEPLVLVDAASFVAGLGVEMRYAGNDNFVGTPVDGYAAPRCLLSEPASRALAVVQRELATQGLGLRVYDCYRPQRAVDHFVRWSEGLSDSRTKARYYPAVDKAELFERGYIARRSSHSRGSTVDLTLLELRADGTGLPLDMGTPFDFFDERAHTDSPSVGPEPRRNRRHLRDAMERAGFVNFPKEWWHYTLGDEPYPDTYGDDPVR